MEYLDLLKKADESNIKVYEYELTENLKGLHYKGNIAIDKKIDTTIEKKCILAEELGHYHLNVGNILDQNDIENMRQEYRGRAWGIETLVSLEDIIRARKKGVRNNFELAEDLNITEEYLLESLLYYKSKYGIYVEISNYLLNLETLEVTQCLASNEFELHKYIKEHKENL